MPMYLGGGHHGVVHHHAAHNNSFYGHVKHHDLAPKKSSTSDKYCQPSESHARHHHPAPSQHQMAHQHHQPLDFDQSPRPGPPPRSIQFQKWEISQDRGKYQANVHQTIMRSMPTRSVVHDVAVRDMKLQGRQCEKNWSKTYLVLCKRVGSLIEQAPEVDSAQLASSGPSTNTRLTASKDTQVGSCTSTEGSHHLPEAERLRGFLSHILSIDYDARKHCPDPLLKEDWIHYTRLARLAFDAYAAHHPPTRSSTILLDWSDECCRHPEVDQHIVAPAVVLGIETSE